MTDRALLGEFEAARSLPNAARRGYALERLVAGLFRLHHFQTILGARAAKPRQVDLLATRGAESYLVEAKWRSDKADINDLDSLRARLGRTAGHVVGVLVSVNGFTGSVLSDVASRARQPVLLVSGDELLRALRGSDPFLRLLHRKLEALLTHGDVLLDEPTSARRGARRMPVVLPASKGEFRWPDGSRSRVLECDGEFGQFVFAQQVPDIDWVPAGGVGVTLDLSPEALTERSVLDLIDMLASLGWATPDARWSLQQSRRNWHGLGAAAFVKTLPKWKERAATAGSHHSEELCYLDRCDGGFYTLTATIGAHSTRRAFPVNISFELQGVPLDVSPLAQLCKAVGAHEPVYFRALDGRSVSRDHVAVSRHPVVPLAYVVEPDELFGELDTDGLSEYGQLDGRETPRRPREFVTGLVVANPFRSGDGAPAALDPPDDLRQLDGSGYLICALVHHHPVDFEPVTYRLRSLEYARATDALVVVATTDWDRVADDSIMDEGSTVNLGSLDNVPINHEAGEEDDPGMNAISRLRLDQAFENASGGHDPDE